jgi:hypothetical protein
MAGLLWQAVSFQLSDFLMPVAKIPMEKFPVN